MCKKFTAATLSALIAVPTIILACIMHGCAVSEHIPERTVVVNMNSDGIVGNDYVSKAFTIERLLPLKTSGIASADKLDIRNGRLYVLDGALHRLWAFSLDGDSLMCINKRGHAGDEYMGITDFAVGDNGDITIYDANSAKIVRYDANGRFKNSVGLDYADGFLLRKNGNAVLLYNRAGKATLTEYAPTERSCARQSVMSPKLLCGFPIWAAWRSRATACCSPFLSTTRSMPWPAGR